MTFATYSKPWPIGEGRGGTRLRTGPTLWLVNHTSEGGEGTDSAEGLARFIGTPSSGGNVASYQAVTDTDEIEQLVGDDYRSHHAAGANDKGLGLCYPGKAAQTRDQWFDGVTGAYLEQGARWLADKCRKYNIPPVRVYADDLRADRPGICGHNDVRLAFGQTTHTDPGPNFPWDWVIARVRQLLGADTPTEDDEVTDKDKLEIIAGVVENIKSLDLVGQMLNYPTPLPDGSTADFWSLVVDGRQRTMALQSEVATLRSELATAQTDLARLTDLADGPR
jgi:hypothetical protein